MTTSGVVGPDQLRDLSTEGYELVINLLPDSSEYAVAKEREIVESQNIEYVYIPVDFRRPTKSDFELFARAMDGAQNKKVHIHCAANYRVSAFYSVYAKECGIWGDKEALDFIRSLWEPAKYAGWPEFFSQVE